MTHKTLFDAPPAQHHRETSVEAAESMRGVSGELCQRVLRHIASCGTEGCTDEEGQDALGLAGNTFRPRRWTLEKAAMVWDSGKRRVTKAGRKSVAWVTTEHRPV